MSMIKSEELEIIIFLFNKSSGRRRNYGIAWEKVWAGNEHGNAVGSVVIKRLALLIERIHPQYDDLGWFTNNEKNKQTWIMKGRSQKCFILIIFSACDGITTHSKESTLSVGVRSLTNGRAGAVGGLFGRAETGTSLNPLLQMSSLYFRHRCRTCNRLPWSS
ncbi:hypothetical protein CEXT_531431 [Caerostris extrusa]|uniref:Uncharacterized protein n=1 Tax=Caerostris extrusa TaxID=172846 RepID=A0AAV4WVX7_CAEEX|nr:hypothetical protein CEXT_531431 [Caerostris extrusa]